MEALEATRRRMRGGWKEAVDSTRRRRRRVPVSDDGGEEESSREMTMGVRMLDELQELGGEWSGVTGGEGYSICAWRKAALISEVWVGSCTMA